MPDRHAGTPRCLHPPERRERVVERVDPVALSNDLQGWRMDEVRSFERCLDCRAVRQLRVVSRQQGLRWGPWVSAGAQVKAALLRQGQERPILSVSGDGNWLVEKK